MDISETHRAKVDMHINLYTPAWGQIYGIYTNGLCTTYHDFITEFLIRSI